MRSGQDTRLGLVVHAVPFCGRNDLSLGHCARDHFDFRIEQKLHDPGGRLSPECNHQDGRLANGTFHPFFVQPGSNHLGNRLRMMSRDLSEGLIFGNGCHFSLLWHFMSDGR
jgi:hypothetical protein